MRGFSSLRTAQMEVLQLTAEAALLFPDQSAKEKPIVQRQREDERCSQSRDGTG